jgi:hypothetical protein
LETTVRSLGAAVAQRVDQRLGDAAQAETADGQQLAVANDAGQRRGGAGVDLVHAEASNGESALDRDSGGAKRTT